MGQSRILLKGIKRAYGVYMSCPGRALRGDEQGYVPVMDDCFILIENGIVKAIDRSGNEPDSTDFDVLIDCGGGLALPSFCDAHTHLVFIGTRERDFLLRSKGLSYKEIAGITGGIRQTQEKTSRCDEETLVRDALRKISHFVRRGYGAIEIKSGYGETLHDEIKILSCINRIKDVSSVVVKGTFMPMHAAPPSHNRTAYIQERMSQVGEIMEKYRPDFVDIFCEDGYYTEEDARTLFSIAKEKGVGIKAHVNQFTGGKALEVAVRYGAVSVDHLEVLRDKDIEVLSKSDTVAVLLPLSTFFLNKGHANPRILIDNGIPVALSSDFNPGTSPLFSPFLIMFLAISQMKMSVEEAFNSLTINGAHAMGLKHHGIICPGLPASLFITFPIKDINVMAYSPEQNPIHYHIVNGKIVYQSDTEPWYCGGHYL